MPKQHPQTAYRKYAVLIGTIFENCDKRSLGLIILYFTGRIHLFYISLSEKQKIDRHGGIRAKKAVDKTAALCYNKQVDAGLAHPVERLLPKQ